MCRRTGHRWQQQGCHWWQTIYNCIGSLAFCQWAKNPDKEDQVKKVWCQIKMMPLRDDWEALQTWIDYNVNSTEAECTPSLTLSTIQSMIKEDVHFWHYCSEILVDFCHLPGEGNHSLHTHITTLVNKCKFTTKITKETISYAFTACCKVPWGDRLDLPTKSKYPELPVPPSSLQIPTPALWAIPASQGSG